MIICAAIKHEGVIYPGRRHCDSIATIQKIFDYRVVGFREQGFIDEKGNYYDRVRAGKLAIKCGQIKKLRFSKTELYSEDLY